MIRNIQSKWARRTVVVLTVAALVVAISAVWLCEAVWRRVAREFGEDIGAAWRGTPRGR